MKRSLLLFAIFFLGLLDLFLFLYYSFYSSLELVLDPKDIHLSPGKEVTQYIYVRNPTNREFEVEVIYGKSLYFDEKGNIIQTLEGEITEKDALARKKLWNKNIPPNSKTLITFFTYKIADISNFLEEKICSIETLSLMLKDKSTSERIMLNDSFKVYCVLK